MPGDYPKDNILLLDALILWKSMRFCFKKTFCAAYDGFALNRLPLWDRYPAPGIEAADTAVPVQQMPQGQDGA
jgi:hypothetical protein